MALAPAPVRENQHPINMQRMINDLARFNLGYHEFESILKQINEFIDKINYIVFEMVLNKYVQHANNSAIQPHTNAYNIINKLLQLDFVLPDSKLMTIINSPSSDKFLLHYTKFKKLSNDVTFNLISNTKHRNGYNILVIDNIHNLTIDIKVLKNACENGLITFVEHYYSRIKEPINVEQTFLHSAVRSDNLNLCKYLVSKGCKMDIISLEEACYKRNKVNIEYILSNKIIPTSNCFNKLITTSSAYDNIKINEIIDMFIIAGYKITKNDIMSATEKRLTINNIENLKIDFDFKFLELCSKINFYPYENIITIKPDLQCLLLECSKKNNLTKIKKIINSGVKPTSNCLYNASSLTSNLPTIMYLTEEHNLKVDPQCIFNHIKSHDESSVYLIKKLASYSKTQIIDNNINIVDEYLKNIKTINKDDENESKNDSEQKQKQKQDPEPEPEPTKLVKTPKIATKQNIICDVDLDNIPTNYNYRIKYKFDDKLITLFTLAKSKVYNFIDIRQKIIIYLIKNKLFVGENIIIDKNIARILDSKINDKINIMHLDKFVYNIIN